jgi:hypothetical protein
MSATSATWSEGNTTLGRATCCCSSSVLGKGTTCNTSQCFNAQVTYYQNRNNTINGWLISFWTGYKMTLQQSTLNSCYMDIDCWVICCSFQSCSLFFLNSHSGRWSPRWVHSARSPLNGLLYLPRVIMMMENLVEWKFAGETKVLGENLPLCPPQIPLDQTRARTRVAAVGSQRLTAWAMERPKVAACISQK